MSQVKVNVGISYVPPDETVEVRSEIGDIIDAIRLRPADYNWMLSDGIIELVPEPEKELLTEVKVRRVRNG